MEPNRLPDPTPRPVTPPAGQEPWPRLGEDHQDVRHPDLFTQCTFVARIS